MHSAAAGSALSRVEGQAPAAAAAILPDLNFYKSWLEKALVSNDAVRGDDLEEAGKFCLYCRVTNKCRALNVGLNKNWSETEAQISLLLTFKKAIQSSLMTCVQ